MEALLGLCQQHDLYLLSDEAYREYCYDGAHATSALSLAGGERHVVVLDTISKRYSACGARVGALVTRNPDVWQAAFHFAQMRVCPPVLEMLLAEGRRDLPRLLLRRHPGRVPGPARPHGGCAAGHARRGVPACRAGLSTWWPACLSTMPRSSASGCWKSFTLDNQTLMLSPANGFYHTPGLGRQEVRLAYVINQTALAAALNCLAHALLVYPGRTEPVPAAAVEAGIAFAI